MESTFDNTKSNAKRAAANPTTFMAEKVGHQVDEVLNKVKNVDVEEQVQALRAKTKEAYNASTEVVRKNPMLAIGGAAAVGFLLGAIVCRK